MLPVLIIDSGICNLSSIKNSLDILGILHTAVTSSSEVDDISCYEGYILPGVGTFEFGMNSLKVSGLDDTVKFFCKSNKKGLAICLGMQLLASIGYENGSPVKGLNLCPGNVTKLSTEGGFVPSVGWCKTRTNPYFHESWSHLHCQDFYYVHSFEMTDVPLRNVVATYERGESLVVAAVSVGQTLGVQFHPEKSHDSGLALIKKFFLGSE